MLKERLKDFGATLLLLVIVFGAYQCVSDEPRQREIALEACTPKSEDDIVVNVVVNGVITCKHHKGTPEQLAVLAGMNLKPMKELK